MPKNNKKKGDYIGIQSTISTISTTLTIIPILPTRLSSCVYRAGTHSIPESLPPPPPSAPPCILVRFPGSTSPVYFCRGCISAHVRLSAGFARLPVCSNILCSCTSTKTAAHPQTRVLDISELTNVNVKI